MKKIFAILLGISALSFASCVVGSENDSTTGVGGDYFTLTVEQDQISTGVETRASVSPEAGETNLTSLYLLFFLNRSDAGGSYIDYREVTSPAMNGNYPIDLTGTLDSDTDYTVLAVANLENYVGDFPTWITANISGRTEKQAVEQAELSIQGISDQSDYTSTPPIQANALPMSARFVKSKSESTAKVALTRMVSRFDVVNNQSANYDLASISIWGAAGNTPVWYDTAGDVTRMARFYGKKVSGAEIKGGLYAFENFVSSPQMGDQVTTCLVVGLIRSGESAPTYYRINVSPEDAGQNLKRNYVYNIVIRNVLSEGYPTEQEAWAGAENRLDVTINNWNLDDEGMILTDGTNTMAVPVKRVKLDPEGDSREYSIFTMGTGTLQISKTDLPASGWNVRLEGNLLKIDADALPASESERTGSIEISFAGLRGTIYIEQSPMVNLYLTLNKYEVPSFPPLGSNEPISDGPITVTSSGSWTATIFNMGTDGDNPGFSFQTVTAGSPNAVTTLSSLTNPLGNIFQIYTTGANPLNDVRYAFVLVSLDEDPSYRQVVVLAQRTKTNIKVSPALEEIIFTSEGAPKGVNGAVSGGSFEFTVDPGMDNGVANPYEVVLEGTDADKFVITSLPGTNRFFVSAAGTNASYPHINLTTNDLNAVLKIRLLGIAESDETRVAVNAKQERLTISTSGGVLVPKTGGDLGTGQLTVNLISQLTWDAAILTNSLENAQLPHAGYLLDADLSQATALSDKPASQKLNAGFPKLLYPNVEVSPVIQVEISVHQNPAIKTTVNITQEAVNAKVMNVLDMKMAANAYGSLATTRTDHFFTYYRNYFKNTSMYGVSGTVPTASNPVINGIDSAAAASDPGTIPTSYVYLNVASQPYTYTQNRHDQIEEWRQNSEGMVVFVNDYRSDNVFYGTGSSSARTTALTNLKYTYRQPIAGVAMGLSKLNTAVTGTHVMQYLMKDGPFTDGTQVSSSLTFYRDDVSSGINPGSERILSGDGIPVIIDNNGTVIVLVDPAGRLVFIGEAQSFHTDTTGYSAPPVLSSSSDVSKFLANLLAYIVNSAQYGSHFTDHFVKEADAAVYALAFQ